jgi:hypothetical protein
VVVCLAERAQKHDCAAARILRARQAEFAAESIYQACPHLP